MTEKKLIKLIKLLIIIPLIFGLILLFDYIIPSAFKQEVVRKSKMHLVGAGRNFPNKMMADTYTDHFKILTNSMFENNEKIIVECTPIFKYPKTIYYNLNDSANIYSEDIEYSIYNGFAVFPFGLVLLSILTIISKKDISDVGAKAFISFLIFIYLLIKVL